MTGFASRCVRIRSVDRLRSLLGSLGPVRGVALDIGCGFAAAAEILQDQMGLIYVGMDGPGRVLKELEGRGFQTQAMDTRTPTRESVEAALAGRPLGVMLLADRLEDFADTGVALARLRDIGVTTGCPLILSVRNVAHNDITLKLAMGQWDYDVGSGGGLGPPRFTAGSLDKLMRSSGWYEVERADMEGLGEQSAAAGNFPALARDTALRHFIGDMRHNADSWGETVRFVRAYLPGPKPVVLPQESQDSAAAGPFLSVVTRTQGKRLDTLRDVLLCLSAQECQDFELIVVGHQLDEQSRRLVEDLIAAVWPGQPDKARLVCVDHGNRTVPLNVGFGAARGTYVAIFDDDDVVFGHWVETFKELAAKHPGRVLRARAATQTVEPVRTRPGSRAVCALSGMEKDYLVDFDLFEHFEGNRSPPVSLAFPRFAFMDFGLHFNEDLTTYEDWDFLIRVALLCGVADSQSITSIWHQWIKAESSRSVHSPEEWDENYAKIQAKLDSMAVVLLEGSLGRVRALLKQARAASQMNQALAQESDGRARKTAEDLAQRARETDDVRRHLAEVMAMVEQLKLAHENEMNQRLGELGQAHAQVAQFAEKLTLMEARFAWRMTAPLRRLAHRFPRTASHCRKIFKFGWRVFTRAMPAPWRKRFRRLVAVPPPALPAPLPRPVPSPLPGLPPSSTPPHRTGRLRIVYISGEPETPGNTYRVIRYAQAATLAGMDATWLKLTDLPQRIGDLAGADVLVIWRAAWCDSLAAAVDAVRRVGGKVVFDMDDLLFDPHLATAEVIDGIRSQKLSMEWIRQYCSGQREAIVAADFCTTTTKTLASHLRRAHKPVCILPNGFDWAALSASRLAVRRRQLGSGDGIFRIGYAGGTRTHQKDFKQAAAAVARILAENSHCRLVLFRMADGIPLLDSSEYPELSHLQDRIEWRDMVSLENLPNEMARFDINLAPLEVGNIYCESKSEIKFSESALVEVCTIASPTEPFRRAIRHAETGLLASTPDDWYASLRLLLDDSDLRRRMARAAFYEVLRTYGPRQRSELLQSTVAQICGGNEGSRAFELQLRRAAALRSALPTVPRADVVLTQDRLGVAEITIVIPLYNYDQYIQEALESVRGQTVPTIDLVIVDDRSTDNSLAVALKWAQQNTDRFNRIVVLRNVQNQGLGLARNVGFDAAETPFVLPLDADNRLLPRCCEDLLAAMRDTTMAFAYPLIRQFGETSDLMGNFAYAPERLVGGNFIDAMAIVAKDAWAVLGGYDGTRSGWEDFGLWCRMAEAGFCGQQVGDAPLAEYRVHRSSMLRTYTDIAENQRKIIAQMEDRHPWLNLTLVT